MGQHNFQGAVDVEGVAGEVAADTADKAGGDLRLQTLKQY